MRRFSRTSMRGFSLVELMVVIVILGLLAGIVGVSVSGVLADSTKETARTQIKNFVGNLEIYLGKYRKYPSSSDGLDALTKKDKNGNVIMKTIPKDPWGRAYKYKLRSSRDFVITSYGADGREGGDGEDADISSDDLGKEDK